MKLEQLTQIANRPGTEVLPKADVTSFLRGFSGNTSDLNTLPADHSIIGIRPDLIEGTKQTIGGNEVNIFTVPVQVMPTAGGTATWKKISVGSLLRTHQDWNPANSVVHTMSFATNGDFMKHIHDHVGNGDDNLTALPAKRFDVTVNPISRVFNEGTPNERKGTTKYYALAQIG